MPTEPTPTSPHPTVQPDGAPELRYVGTPGFRNFVRVSDRIPPGEVPAAPKRKAASRPKAKAKTAAGRAKA